jgi:asparagine synthase (glutamine-hydrolysing)
MCGIAGFAGSEPIAHPQLELMRDTLVHRGPDDRGLWYSPDRSVGLAHRRLAVIDLSPGGHQPMSDASGALGPWHDGDASVLGQWRDLEHDLLESSAIFDRSAIDDLFAAQTASGAHGQRLFALMAFELWRREYRAYL